MKIFQAPDYFPPVNSNYASMKEEWRSSWELKPEEIRKGLLPGADTMQYFEGFPSLKYISHDVSSTCSIHKSIKTILQCKFFLY